MGPNTTMPVSVCESSSTVAVIGSAIRDSLSSAGGTGSSSGASLAAQMKSSLKHSLLTKIEYEEAPPNLKNSVHDELKSKYTFLNVSSGSSPLSTSQAIIDKNGVVPLIGPSILQQCSTNNKEITHIPTPKRILFPRESVQIGWKPCHKWYVGAGMINVGNTCYLNSTLQALFHVPAFANWLLSDEEHREKCEEISGSQGGCIICAMSKTFIASQKTQQPIKPWLVYSKLRIVCRHLVPGHQEDAHEFLRYLMEAMEKAFLFRFKNSKEFDQYTKETTPINQILGGYLKSSVRCLACHHVSVTFQHFEDLLLDIRKANSIEEALEGHFARERLEDMGYKCEACKKKVSATKQFSLERPPVALCIQLKRFSMMGGKLNKQVTIRQKLDLSPYASRKSTEPLTYKLVSMVTHLGASQHCGHYTAIGLTESGSYYQFDDSCVRPISLQNVLNTNAYIIFYELDNGISSRSMSTATVTSKSASLCQTSTSAQINGSLQQNNSNTSILSIGNSLTNYSNGGSKLVNNINKSINGFGSSLNGSLNGNSNLSKPTSNGLNSSALSSPLKSVHNSENKISIRLKTTLKKDESNSTQQVITNGESNENKTFMPLKKISSPTKLSTSTSTVEVKSENHVTANVPSLPSMPKLDSPPVLTNTSSTPSPSAALSKLNFYSTRDDEKPRKLNGFVKINGQTEKPKSLVPYTSDDDDDSDSNHTTSSSLNGLNNGKHEIHSTKSEIPKCPSPPIIRTNSAGEWQVSSCPVPPTALSGATAAVNNSTTPPNNSNPFSRNRPHLTSPHHQLNATNKSNSYNSKFGNSSLQRSTSDSTVNKLQKISSMGYGGSTKSWTGHQSAMDKEVACEKSENDRKRSYNMSADEDLDRGRQKKVKHNFSNQTGRDNPGYNQFQEHQQNNYSNYHRNNWFHRRPQQHRPSNMHNKPNFHARRHTFGHSHRYG